MSLRRDNMNSRSYLLLSFITFLLIIPAITEVSAVDQVSVKEEKIQSDDVTLFVRTAGNPAKAPVLIAINGGPGQSSHYMKTLEQLAGPELTVVTFDQRGTGRSTASARGYDLLEYVADIEAIRKHLRAKKIYLFGHSFGGILAQRYASVHPKQVLSLILMGSGPPKFAAIGMAQMKLGQRIQQLIKQGIISGPRPTEPAKILEYMLPAYFSNPKFPIPEELRQSSFHPAVSQKTYSDSGNWDFSLEEKAITCPVLFLWGEDDPFGMEMAEVSKSALVSADLRFVILKKCGHYWHENIKDFFSHIREFLKKKK